MKYVLFILIALFWGGSFIAIKDVVLTVPPMMAATLRMAAALIFLIGFYAVTRKKFFVSRKMLWKVWLTGLFIQGIPFSLLFWGEQRISAGLAGILNGCTPVFTFILSLIFLKDTEKISISSFLGLLVSVGGMIIIFYPKLHLAGSQAELWGAIAVFLMAASYGVGTVLARRNFNGKDKINMHAGLFQQIVASFVYLTILSFLFEDWTANIHKVLVPSVFWDVIYLGCVSSSIAFLIFYYLMAHWGAIRASAVTYLVPMAAILFDYVFNHKIPLMSELGGAIVILAGICLIQFSHYISAFRAK